MDCMAEKDKQPNNQLSEKDLMVIGDIIEKMRTILHDRDSLNILTELLINQKLNYDELKNKLKSINQDTLDSKLSFLIDSDLIKLKNKDYFLSIIHFQNLLDNTKKFREPANLLRESRITYQILFQILLNHELDTLLNTSSADYLETYMKKPALEDFSYLTFLLVNKDIFTKYKKKLDPIYKELVKEIAEQEQKKPLESIGPFLFYYGFLFFPELNKE